MSDTSTQPEPQVIHHGLTQAQLDEKVLEAKNEIRALHDEHTRASDDRIAKLQDRIDELEADKAARKKADEDAAAAKGGGSTMVTPPAAMPAAQPSTPDPATAPSTEHEGGGTTEKKPSFFKRAW